MNIMSSEQDIIEMKLKQIGAKVQSIHGLLCYVRYQIDDIELLYVYNINAKKQYFLQRVTPYPIGAGTFSNQKEIVSFIKKDIAKFEVAKNSKIFKDYIALNQKLHRTVHQFENVFLDKNIPAETVEQMNDSLDAMIDCIHTAEEKGQPVLEDKK